MMPRLKESLERAGRIAGRGLVEPDHLLLGMLQVRGALAVEALRTLGVTPEMVMASMLTHRQAS
jgi:hypothetical protein